MSSTNKKNPEEKMEKKILKEDDDGKNVCKRLFLIPPPEK